MRAAVFYEAGKPLVVEEVTLGRPQKGEVLVKIAGAGICRSDLHIIDGILPWPAPAVLGHEAAGVIVEIGEGVTLVQPGDHVIISFTPSCGVCRYCANGKPYLCVSATGSFLMSDGTSRLSKGGQSIFHFLRVSAFAEYAVLLETAVVKIRDDVPLDKISIVGCAVTTGVGAAVNTAKVKWGSSVAVFGCGGVGLNVIQGAVLAGAAQIIAVDTQDNKLETARQFGATHTVNSTKEDAVAKIREITTEGVDYAFEVIGNVEVLAQAFEVTDRGGTTVMVGAPPLTAQLTLNAIGLFPDKSLRGCIYGSTKFRADMPALVDLYMLKRLKIDELISRVYPLEGINEAFQALRDGEVARSIIKF